MGRNAPINGKCCIIPKNNEYIKSWIVKPHRFTAPVYFASNAGLARDVIGEVVLLNILGISITELGVSDRNTLFYTVLVLLPQQLECHACLLSFRMDILIVDGCIHRLHPEFVQEKEQVHLILAPVCDISEADTESICSLPYR